MTDNNDKLKEKRFFIKVSLAVSGGLIFGTINNVFFGMMDKNTEIKPELVSNNKVKMILKCQFPHPMTEYEYRQHEQKISNTKALTNFERQLMDEGRLHGISTQFKETHAIWEYLFSDVMAFRDWHRFSTTSARGDWATIYDGTYIYTSELVYLNSNQIS